MTILALGKRLALSVSVLIAYRLSFRIPLPTVRLGEVFGLPVGDERFSVVALGLAPFLTGFLVVELFSFLPPWGRRIRAGGAQGRRKLNSWSLRLSLLFCTVQAVAVTLAIESIRSPEGGLLVPDPGPVSRLVTVLTLVAGSAALYALCSLVTERGFGNGFCLALLADFLVRLVVGARPLMDPGYGSNVQTFLLLIAGVAALSIFVGLYRHPAYFQASLNGVNHGRLPLPALPQSLAPLAWTFGLMTLPSAFGNLLGKDLGSHDLSPYGLGPLPLLTSIAILVPLLSLAAVNLFSTRARVEANVPKVSLSEGFDLELKNRLYKTTAVLTALALAVTALEIYAHWFFLIDLVEYAAIAAIGTDLFEEGRFRTKHPASERLLELDNVHLALSLQAALREEGIPSLVQAAHFRSLFFFFRPLYKMTVLVPAHRVEEARERVAGLDVRIY